MKAASAFLILSLSLLVQACSDPVGVPVEVGKACSMDYDKKTVEVSGFLDDKGGVFCSNIGGGNVKCGFRLLENVGGERVMSADIEQGTSANTVEKLERGYKKEDIKIRDRGGNIINMAEKVKLTGDMMVTPDQKVCLLKVAKIEK